MVKENPDGAKGVFLAHPQLAYALFQAMLLMNVVDPSVLQVNGGAKLLWISIIADINLYPAIANETYCTTTSKSATTFLGTSSSASTSTIRS